MRPMFKKGAVGFQQGFEVFGFVGLAAGEQDHVMRALDSVDAVNLHKTEAVDQRGQIGTLGWASGGIGQGVPVQKNAPGCGVWKDGKGHVTAVAGTFAWSRGNDTV